MSRIHARLAPLLLLVACEAPPDATPTPPPVAFDLAEVDVFAATGGQDVQIGSAYPGPAMPFGMIHPGPDTRAGLSALGALHCSGYRFQDAWISAFSHTRMHGTGVPDYGAVAVMPWAGSIPGATDAQHRLEKARERGAPGWYAVDLLAEAGAIEVELTAGKRAAWHRLRFPEASPRGVLLDLSHALPDVEVTESEWAALDDRTVAGRVHFTGPYSGRHGGETVWFELAFDRPWSGQTAWTAAEVGRDGVFFTFDDAALELTVGVSFVDADGARGNRLADLGASFDATRAAAEAAWSEALARAQVGGGTPEDRSIWATAVYHAMLMPTLFTDADGRYRGFDGAVHSADGWTYFTDLSLWDTFRTQHPLLELIAPESQADFVRSLLTMGAQGGRVPRWPLGTGYTGGMIGENQDPVIVGTLLHGGGGGTLEEAWERLMATRAQRGGDGQDLETYGWVPADRHGGSVSKTLELAFADAVLADLAAALGKPEEAALRQASTRWRNHFHAPSGFFRGRYADGSWVEEVDLLDIFDEHFVEGDSWQYRWFVPHDVEGLIEILGGQEAFVAELSTFFEQSEATQDDIADLYYWHGNEPDIHAPFLFALAGRPDLARQWADWVARSKYRTGPDALDGNDDAGTLSAWYLWASAGLYPLAGTDRVILTEPRFPQVALRAGEGTLTTRRFGTGAALRVEIDGEPWDAPEVPWARIAHGATIDFIRAAE